MKDNDIITFEMAKKAKKAGLRITSSNFYREDGKLDTLIRTRLNFNLSDYHYTAVTYGEYLKWINTKKQ